jgi:hypothetical protein
MCNALPDKQILDLAKLAQVIISELYQVSPLFLFYVKVSHQNARAVMPNRLMNCLVCSILKLKDLGHIFEWTFYRNQVAVLVCIHTPILWHLSKLQLKWIEILQWLFRQPRETHRFVFWLQTIQWLLHKITIPHHLNRHLSHPYAEHTAAVWCSFLVLFQMSTIHLFQ